MSTAPKNAPPANAAEEKAKALQAALAQIEKQFGKGAIMRLGEGEKAEDIQVVSTGSLGLDVALGVDLLNLAPKDLEKVIYFAAYMVTEVDEEGRHDDLPSLRAELEVKKKHVEEAGLADVEARAQRLESELAQLEAEGAEASQRDKLRKTAEREMGALRRKTQRALEHMDKVWDRFVSLKVGDLEGDEVLYRDMVADYGIYFKGAMGAEAIQSRLRTFDLEGEAAALAEVVAGGSGQRKTRAIKRLKVINAFRITYIIFYFYD